MEKYTELELVALNLLKEVSEYTTEIYSRHIMTDLNDIGYDSKIMRGVLSSLVTKKAIDIDHKYDGFISILDEDYDLFDYDL